MAFDGYLKFDTKIDKTGFNKGISEIGSGLDKFKNQLKNIASLTAVTFSVNQIRAFAKECKSLWNIQLEAETKLETVLGRNIGATREQIQATKEWASELQTVGVIGDEVQLSGLQELSTYIENADSLRIMNVVLNDMLAQQYGLNASAESAVTIATMLGKVLEGQTSALSRYGYSFDEAQEKLLKFGTEEQRVATLAEVVKASVGGMNEALAKTPAGRLKQVENAIGDVKEQFGKAVTNLQAVFLPVLENVVSVLENAANLAVKFSESIASVFGIELGNSANVSSNIHDSISAQEELTDAVEKTNKVQKNGLASFDKMNVIKTENTEDSEVDETGKIGITPVIQTDNAKKVADELSEKIEKLLEPIKLAWNTNSPELLENVSRAIENVKSLGKSIAVSFETIWENGTGEEFVSNIIRNLSDIYGVIGDISLAMKIAWDDGGRGTALIQSKLDKLNAILELIHEINSAFRTAWNDGTGVEICANILEILTNINNIWANLITQIKNAWTENEVGVRIFSAILGFVNNILTTINKLTASVAEWVKTVDFSPFLQSVAGLLESLKPLSDSIGEGLLWFLENVLEPLAKWTIEDFVPAFINLLSSAIGVLNGVILAFKPLFKWLWDKFLKKIASWTGGVIVDFLNSLSDSLKKLGDWINKNPNSAVWFVGLSAGIIALKTACQGGVILDFLAKFRTGLKTLSGMNVTVGVIVAGLAGWIYTITELKNNWNDIIETIEADGGIFRFIGNWLDDCREEIEGFFSDSWLGEIGAIWLEMWENFGGTLYDLGGNVILGFFEGISDKISDIFLWVDQNIFTPIVQSFKELFGIHSPSTVMVELGDYVMEGLFSGISDKIQKIKEIFETVLETIQKVFSGIRGWFSDKFKSAYNSVKSAFSGIGDWFSARWNDVAGAFSEVGTWFHNKFSEAWSNIVQIFSDIGGWFGEKWDSIKSVFSEVGTVFSNWFGTARNNIADTFSGIVDWFGERWHGIKSVFSTVADSFKNWFGTAWENVKSIFSNPKEFFDGVWSAIKGCFSRVTDWFRDTFSEAWTAVKGVFSKGGEVFSGIKESIAETFKTVVNGLIDGINNVIYVPFSAINSALNGIRDWYLWTPWGDFYPFDWLPEISIPEIPHLAQGTVVPANYGEFLAVLGDNKRETEVVSPIGTIEKAVENVLQKYLNNAPQTINVKCELDGKEIGRVAVKAVNQDKIRRGR